MRPRALLDAVVVATALAGAIGVARQRAEAQAVRRGALPAASAAADLAPARPDGRLTARLATWTPPVPRTPLGRLAAWSWAAPLTAAGLVLATVGGARPRWDPGLGCLVATGVRGPSGAALRIVGAEANTVGHVVLCRTPTPSDVLLAHEAVHVRHGERLGVLLLPCYVWLTARFGYRDHPLERAARHGARHGARHH